VDVRDPFTGTLYRAGTPIPMTGFARKVLNDLPAPNAAGANNFQQLVPNRVYNEKFNIRLDHRVDQNLNTFVRISHRKVNNFEGPNIPGPSGSNQNILVRVLHPKLSAGTTP